jgi:two-component system nitrogen regulation sensor histidine kinase GlnL
MNSTARYLLASHDEDLARRIAAALAGRMQAVPVYDPDEADHQAALQDPAALLFDVRCGALFDHLDEWMARHPGIPVIAIAPARSERLRPIEHLDLLAVIEPDADFRAWQNILRIATRQHALHTDLASARAPAPLTPPLALPPPPPREGRSIIAHVAGAFRHFEQVDLMLDRAVEGLAAAAHTTRAGLFARDETATRFRLRAGLRYLKEAAQATYEPRDPLVRWFERNAHMVTRSLAAQQTDPATRALLLRSLELTGADVLAPLHARGELLGWLFIGCRTTGEAYTPAELEELSMAADYIAMLMENAQLYREVAVQKSLAETLLHALPTGIVAVDGSGAIRWFSTAAETMLGRPATSVIGQRIETLGSRLADALRRALAGSPLPAAAWEEPAARRLLRIEALRLGGPGESLGAVATLQDLSALRHLQEKQEELERAAFWTDLAAGLSHEIRNPLVTIRTFAQLLPERYQDADFRDEFSTLVGGEVERLDGIINQINEFAHPPAPTRTRLDVRETLRQALQRVFTESPPAPVRIDARLDGNLPVIEGDERALTDCFVHLFQNAREATADREHPAITYSARTLHDNGTPRVEISIEDNGRGIPPESQEKLFSPFFTTKARGMGLGLPIVRRTVIDHNGRVQVASSEQGTRVAIELPALPTPAGGNPP